MKLLDSNLVASESGIKWSDAAGMRDWLTHHYFDTSRAVIEATITEDLPPLEAAVEQLHAKLELSEQHYCDAQVSGRKNDHGIGR